MSLREAEIVDYQNVEGGINQLVSAMSAQWALSQDTVLIQALIIGFLRVALQEARGTPTAARLPVASIIQLRRITKLRISVMSSMANRTPSRPRPESLTPP